MEEFIREALAEYAECHAAKLCANIEGLSVVAVVDLGDGEGLKTFRIRCEQI